MDEKKKLKGQSSRLKANRMLEVIGEKEKAEGKILRTTDNTQQTQRRWMREDGKLFGGLKSEVGDRFLPTKNIQHATYNPQTTTTNTQKTKRSVLNQSTSKLNQQNNPNPSKP
jgi:hypothetical protein